MKKILLFLLFFIPTILTAQQLVYSPINPSFLGGNSFNASWLLSSAESQNKLKEETNANNQSTELEQFTETLNRQLLSSLSRDLFSNTFGNESFKEGTFTFGSLVVDMVPTSTGLSIGILDTDTGEQSQIFIPN
ncbi:curli assembly protein CsgF [Aureibaculum marinum]|uniref:Curli production assembly/transport component CsgF n=1 Tax=Aureibaculum marinum TaxID=2487930 RepID=A0A3N4NVR9_9FLAO|nr:curli assembly protein CsgF [Aureibaculum marinum]RPD98807.1 curli assembly protein CsgF [Aureibaculum marinum]